MNGIGLDAAFNKLVKLIDVLERDNVVAVDLLVQDSLHISGGYWSPRNRGRPSPRTSDFPIGYLHCNVGQITCHDNNDVLQGLWLESAIDIGHELAGPCQCSRAIVRVDQVEEEMV